VTSVYMFASQEEHRLLRVSYSI